MAKRKVSEKVSKEDKLVSDLVVCLLIDDLDLVEDKQAAVETLKSLLDEYKKMKASIESSQPICHTCKSAMVRASYEGFYDSFDFWDCDCADGAIPVVD
jgi:hypothetical protein